MARLGACATPSTITEEYFRVLSFAIETYRGNMPLRFVGRKKCVYYSNFRIIQKFLQRINVLPY